MCSLHCVTHYNVTYLPEMNSPPDTRRLKADNENIVMLPDEMFVNLIDMDLQNWIAIANDLDSDVAQALKLLLVRGAGTRESS